MPLAATTYMLLVRPTPGGDDDIWDDELNTLLGLVDAHDHTTGKGPQVPSAGLNINANLGCNNHRLTSVAGLALQNLGAPLAAGSDELFVDGNNLKFRNAGGTNVRITNGNALDVTTVGAIAGDYTAVGAEVAFTDGSDLYTFKQQVGAAVRQFAKMQCADILLTEYKAQPAAGVPANAVTLKSPAALAGPYTLTMPAALPASTQPLLVSATGALSAPNTVRTIVIPVTAGFVASGAPTYSNLGHISGNVDGFVAFSLPAGVRITQAVITYNRAGGAGNVTYSIERRTADGAGANIQSVGTTGAIGAGAAWTTATIAAINHTILAGWEYFWVFDHSDAAHSVAFMEITFDSYPP